MSIRFPKGRASERVVNDILQIADGIKARGPIPMGAPITEAAIVDWLVSPDVPEDTMTDGSIIDAQTNDPAMPPPPEGAARDPLVTNVAKGANLIEGL